MPADDDRLVAAALEVARRLRPHCPGWPEDRFAHLAYSAALADLRGKIPEEVLDRLRRAYAARRSRFLARLRERAD
jgi:hypothetical protein